MKLASSPTPIAEALKGLRGRTTLDEMAPKVSVGRSSLVRYESGDRLPDQDFLAAFAEATGADFLELLRLRLASSPDEPARRMAERLVEPKSARAKAEDLEQELLDIERMIRAERNLGSVGVTPPLGAVQMAMHHSAEGSLPEVEADLLLNCLSACSTVHGAPFSELPSAEQLRYAIELYNMLVKMAGAAKPSKDARHSFARLEPEGIADQLRLFVKMGWVRTIPLPTLSNLI